MFFFFNDTATTEIYTLSLHDALPIFNAQGLQYAFLLEAIDLPEPPPNVPLPAAVVMGAGMGAWVMGSRGRRTTGDRKSTRLNSSHANISYAVFCLKKKNRTNEI